MPADRKAYIMQRRSLTTIHKFRNEEEYYRFFFPNIANTKKTNELIEKQHNYLTARLAKKHKPNYFRR